MKPSFFFYYDIFFAGSCNKRANILFSGDLAGGGGSFYWYFLENIPCKAAPLESKIKDF